MDATFSPEDRAFREEVRAFLRDHLPEELRAAKRRATSIFEPKEVTRAWHAILHRQGWSAPGWPREHGGTGWTIPQKYIWEVETAAADAPGLSPMGMRMVSHVIMKYGRQDQKDFFLPKILSGEHYWCQGYSEPGAGSDLAGLKCRATPDGTDYIVEGTKIWTTQAHLADWMFCLVRTDDSGKKQEGITFLLIDMTTPGITIRPIPSISGSHEFNQVFFDAVRVPQANRIGEEGQGWTYAKYLLEFERGGGSGTARLGQFLKRLRHVAGSERANGHAVAEERRFRHKLAALEADLTALEYTEMQVMSRLSQGGSPGNAASGLKIRRTEIEQALTELTVEALGYEGLPWQPPAEELMPRSNEPPIGPDYAAAVVPTYLNSRACTIYGGSNEIQRDIIAKAVLGL